MATVAAEPHVAPRLGPAWEALENPAVSVVTSDVFDTLVWRIVARPTDAFALVAERLAAKGLLVPDVSPELFGRLRREAEARARETRSAVRGDGEIRLREIYDALPGWVLLPHANLTEVIEAEVAVEQELVVVDLDVAAVLAAAQAAGKMVALVSDNYLGVRHLRAILAQPGLDEVVFPHVFCSCDHRTGKGAALFDVVLADLAVAPEAVVHLGDNPAADVDAARARGMGAVLVPQRPPDLDEVLEREERIAPALPAIQRGDAGMTALRGKVLAEAPALDALTLPYWTWGASVLGPVLTGFADWVVTRAERRGVARVHCLMREGVLLADLINATATYRDASVEAVPLWLNRRVAVRAAAGADVERAVRALYDGRTPLTLRVVLDLLGLDIQDVPALGAQAETRLSDPTTLRALLAELDDTHVRAKAAASSRVLADRVTRLLRAAAQDEDQLALVDLGWGASIQTYAQQVLNEAGSALHTVGLYLMTGEAAVSRMATGVEAHGYLGDAGGPAPQALQLFLRAPEVIEQICSAPIASQVGLHEDLTPVIGDRCEPALQQHQSREVRAGARRFADVWGRYRSTLPGKVPALDARSDVLRPILLRAVVDPTSGEAVQFGDWEHDEGRGSTGWEHIAGLDGSRLARHGHPGQLKDLSLRRLYWPFGLVARAGEEEAALVSAAASNLVPWEALSSPLENGSFTCTITEGVGVADAQPEIVSVPRRNLRGLSLAVFALRAPAIHVVEVKPAFKPHLLRLDWLRVRLWEQGSEEPREVVLADADTALQTPMDGYEPVAAPNTFLATTHVSTIRLDLRPLARGVVFGADIECGFVFVPVTGTRGASERAQLQEELGHAQAALVDLQTSASWRLTRPLRVAKRLLPPNS